ncbi:acetylornithine transaminase [Clavibacter michiganensis subsp. michiganensis]|uniref:acetylornithine transaminase n=1 Tax=Clavibacter michiganensis TaxID=28447 RepID=UPI0013656FFC|nr:acetylornithine transaminase [Clavibacter michiganensis]MWJ84400.1 acetylornithine transaminase [Clavibacter michiganensis subsp. michiganensis]
MTTTQPERRTTQTESEWSDRFQAAMMRSSPPPLAMLVRGEGCRVWDSTGREYLDFLAGIAVNSLGHAHPALIRAVTEQVSTLAHVSNYFATPPQIALAERLRRITGAGDTGRVYFGNSGAEANEAAFKLARRNGSAQRTRVITLQGSFHGRTMGALALTGQPALQAPFLPLPGGVEHIAPTLEALEAAIDDTVQALILEPIQGEAGVVDLPAGFLRRARELTREHGALLILDEIQTGVGRTGRWFAYEHEGVRPDAVTIAKGIAGGVPIGALVAFDAAADLLQKGQHGSTFGGNPLATAAGNAVLTEIEDAGLVENAARRGEEIRAAITGLDSPLIAEVRGRGLLIGVGLHHEDAGRIAAAALGEGLIINAPNARSLRIAPPLIVGDDEVRDFRERFGRALAHLR